MVGVEVHDKDIINKEEEEDDDVIKKDHSKDDVINKEDEDDEEEDSDYEYFETDKEEDYDYENCETDNEEDNDYENYNNYIIDEEEDNKNIIIKQPYQHFDLLKTRFAQKRVAISSLEGTEINKPTNLSKESELHEFENLVSSSNDPNNGTMKRTIPPPLFRLMQKKGYVKMVPHNLMWDSQKKQEGGKGRDDDYVKFVTNADFVKVTSLTNGYQSVPGLPGDGYKIVKGKIIFLIVYFVWKKGFAFSCERVYMKYSKAKVHLANGTGDILARRT
jgi:hypothetical protein